jgi:hypothetical protein
MKRSEASPMPPVYLVFSKDDEESVMIVLELEKSGVEVRKVRNREIDTPTLYTQRGVFQSLEGTRMFLSLNRSEAIPSLA